MKGWHKESYRHYLAAKGIKTNYYAKRKLPIYMMAKWDSAKEKHGAIGRLKDKHRSEMQGVNYLRSQDLKNETSEFEYDIKRKVDLFQKDIDELKKMNLLTEEDELNLHNWANMQSEDSHDDSNYSDIASKKGPAFAHKQLIKEYDEHDIEDFKKRNEDFWKDNGFYIKFMTHRFRGDDFDTAKKKVLSLQNTLDMKNWTDSDFKSVEHNYRYNEKKEDYDDEEWIE